jgi:hypothetical protein
MRNYTVITTFVSRSFRIFILLSSSFLALGYNTKASELLEGEARSLGEIVVINGVERPDLVDQFDLLKHHVVLLRGVAFAKDASGGIVIPDVLSQELSDDLENYLNEAREREQEILKKTSSKKCQSCQHCGVEGSQCPANDPPCPTHGSYPSCQACGGCLTPPGSG